MRSIKDVRVLLATFFPKHVGGLQTHFDLLLEGLRKAGFTVFSLQRDPSHWSLLNKALSYLRFGLSKERALCNLIAQDMVTFSNVLRDCIGKYGVKLVHCHDVFSVCCARGMDLPLVLTVHGPLHLECKMLGWKDRRALEWLLSIEREAYDLADVIIAVDSGQRDYVLRTFGVDPGKIRVVRNAVDVEKVLSLAQRNPGLEIDSPFALVPRRLVPKNGVEIAVSAMRFLRDLPCKLVIAGDGPDKGKIISLLKNYGLQNKVILLGEVQHEKIFSIMKKSFAVIVPSVPSEGVVEATSLAVLEAMALGKVVIASSIGGLKELIDDNLDGFLFEAGNDEELAKILRKVFEDEALRDRVGVKAREKILLDYTLSTWLSRILGIYEELGL